MKQLPTKITARNKWPILSQEYSNELGTETIPEHIASFMRSYLHKEEYMCSFSCHSLGPPDI